MLTQSSSPRSIDNPITIKNDWQIEEVLGLFDLPFNDLLHQAQTIHRQSFDANEIQLSALLNIKEGGCPEDCAYCPQSVRYDTGVNASEIMDEDEVLSAAREARANGAGRFCMGAAWRSPKDRDIKKVIELVATVKTLGMETCATLGMLSRDQAQQLKDAGLDFYNHNLDTSPGFYKEIISTRDYQDRLQTLEHVRNAGLRVCCGGIVGMGENVNDRAGLLLTLANLPEHPESVPINMLVRVEGTPLAREEDIDPFDMIRCIAVSRIMMPRSYVRLSAGRSKMSDTMQALCFHAGANSIFYGEKLLTTDNPEHRKDMQLFNRLGLKAQS